MTHTLISFLGKGNPDRGRRYRQATYDFGAGCKRPTEFFGLALAEEIKPDRLLVLGTTGSMWDVLLVSLDLGEVHEDALLQITESADTDCVTQSELDDLAPVVSERLGLAVTLRLIPYGRDTQEQLSILHSISTDLRPGDYATLDITHGFRHLPMLTQLSALYLRTAAQVHIKGIYYGALEMTPPDGPTPVMNLDGLLRIADWIGALHTFDKDGDYSVFANLLEQDGLTDEQTNHLRRAAFFERTSNAKGARSELLNFEAILSSELPGVGNLFTEQLRERTRWHKHDDLFTWQRDLAKQYLSREDYIRAAIFAYEAFVTRLMQDKTEQVWNYRDRENAYKAYEAGERGFQHLKSAYFRLKNIRNTLAHGNRSEDSKIRTAISAKDKLHTELRTLIKSLLQ